jgi:hypothetical protein
MTYHYLGQVTNGYNSTWAYYCNKKGSAVDVKEETEAPNSDGSPYYIAPPPRPPLINRQ